MLKSALQRSSRCPLALPLFFLSLGIPFINIPDYRSHSEFLNFTFLTIAYHQSHHPRNIIQSNWCPIEKSPTRILIQNLQFRINTVKFESWINRSGFVTISRNNSDSLSLLLSLLLSFSLVSRTQVSLGFRCYLISVFMKWHLRCRPYLICMSRMLWMSWMLLKLSLDVGPDLRMLWKLCVNGMDVMSAYYECFVPILMNITCQLMPCRIASSLHTNMR